MKQVTGTPGARKQLWAALAVVAYLSLVAVLIAFAVRYWPAARLWLPWAAGGAILAGFCIWVWVEEGPPRLSTDPSGRMQLWKASFLVPDAEDRVVLRPGFAPVVEARRGDVCVVEPFLDLGDVGLVPERLGGRHIEEIYI